MKEAIGIMESYGFGKEEDFSQIEMDKIWRDISELKPLVWKIKTNVLKNKVFSCYVKMESEIFIKEPELFLKRLLENNIELPFQPWKLQFLCVVNNSFEGEPVFDFNIKRAKIQSVLRERLEKDKEKLKIEEPEFVLECVFDKEAAIDKMEDKIWYELEEFSTLVENQEFMFELARGLFEILWEDYQRVNKSKS